VVMSGMSNWVSGVRVLMFGWERVILGMSSWVSGVRSVLSEVRSVLSGVRVLMFHRVIPGDTRKHHFFARPEISRLNRDEIWQTEWCMLFSDINSISWAGPSSFPVPHSSKEALQVLLPGGASEDYLANRCEITSSDCCISSSGTTRGRPECGKISAMWCWWSTWWRILTLLGEPELA
jgi:hypothetical protein